MHFFVMADAVCYQLRGRKDGVAMCGWMSVGKGGGGWKKGGRESGPKLPRCLGYLAFIKNCVDTC